MHEVKTKAGRSVLESERRCEFQWRAEAAGLSEVREALSVVLISLDVHYRLAEWKWL